jgi:hypothetical protein
MPMSIETLLFWIGCGLSYKLGAFNQQHPGRLLEILRQGWRWMNA